jgi:hypothetical protein
MPYRYPILRILTIRAEKILNTFRTNGMSASMANTKGYVLELLQLGIDYAFYRADLEKHSVFNMRPFLSEAN